MKFLESHFEEYTNAVEKINLHPKLEKCFSKFPETLDKLGNLIFYGPSGVGKYSQMLYSIKKYSPTDLKYEKKLNVTYDKKQYLFKISDIHYEIDMSLLGCNSKLLWHEIYNHIVDIVSLKPEKNGIILCKYFNEIQIELLENFYSYMQINKNIINEVSTTPNVNIVFILITENLSFIPDNILNCCNIIHFPRPTLTSYNNILHFPTTTLTKCHKYEKLSTSLTPTIIKQKDITNYEKINNIKNLFCNLDNPIKHYDLIANKIVNEIMNDTKFSKIRELIYDIFVYNLNIQECIFKIISLLIERTTKNKINEVSTPSFKLSEILIKTYTFLKYYNNNYRPIYHTELYFYYLIKIIKDLKE
jgi:hypothetical protein